jgi:tetratricopeptide (TPR) repeat protein
VACAVVVLGMHRSGTSCLAGMLAAAGVASAGRAIRNWDNARGHHEMLELVRLDERVLAHSGAHWLAAPRELRWTDDDAAERDRLLRARIDDLPALLKDPRMLLALPFWRASTVPFAAIGIVRHPLAVARSLESWRGMPLADGLALWLAHNRALAADRERHGVPVIDFDAPAAELVAAVARASAAIVDHAIDRAALASAYEDRLVHHDVGDAPNIAGLDEALALYRALVGSVERPARAAFPREALAEVARRLTESGAAALEPARAALASAVDAPAVLVPLVAAFSRRRAYAEARVLIAEHAARLDAGLADLLLGKVALAAGDGASAARHLEAACAVSQPLFQARHLWPHALRAAGRLVEARAALEAVAGEALYPHGALSTLAEWSWLDGDRDGALAQMQRAIDAAPLHRRGRLRTRRAEWLVATGDRAEARRELAVAADEDPAYTRSRELLASLD